MALSEKSLTTLALLLVITIVALIVLSVFSPELAIETENRDPELVQPHEGSSAFWPYTTSRLSFDSRTIDINLIVYGDRIQFQHYLTKQNQAEERWDETDEEQLEIDPEEPQPEGPTEPEREWGGAGGSVRYLYIDGSPHGGEGQWIKETRQLHNGDYLGSRYHLRLYESPYPEDNWTAIQAHTEHWDWFQLRHAVDSTDRAQRVLETEFLDRWFVEEVRRVHLGNDDVADADGWATVIELPEVSSSSLQFSTISAVNLVVGGVIASLIRRDASESVRTQVQVGYDRLVARIDPHPLFLFSSLILVYLFVRMGGIAVERYLLESPKLGAAMFYPILVIGLPVCAYVFGRATDRLSAFVAAVLGMTTAILVDYTYLGVSVLPLSLIVHRVSVVLAIGLIAVGAATQSRDGNGVSEPVSFRAGRVLWFIILVQPFIRWLPVF